MSGAGRPDGFSVAVGADAIASEERAGNHAASYRAFLQIASELENAVGFDRVAMVLQEPEQIGSRWDDALAALTEYRLDAVGIPAPRWVQARTGDATTIWTPQRGADTGIDYLQFIDLEAVPAQFRSRGIAIEAGELESV